jgi:hypothetical protein
MERDVNLTPQPPTYKPPSLHLVRGTSDPSSVALPDPVLCDVVRRWRQARAELGLAKLLERNVRVA